MNNNAPQRHRVNPAQATPQTVARDGVSEAGDGAVQIIFRISGNSLHSASTSEVSAKYYKADEQLNFERRTAQFHNWTNFMHPIRLQDLVKRGVEVTDLAVRQKGVAGDVVLHRLEKSIRWGRPHVSK